MNLERLFLSNRKAIIAAFAVFVIVCGYFITQLNFAFSFEQFFPEGDEDLEFFKEFSEEFETDDNFLLIAIKREEGVFDSTFLNKFHAFSLDMRDIPHVTKSQSLTQLKFPLKTPFGFTTIPAIHLNKPSKYESDKKRLEGDQRIIGNFIAKDFKSLAVVIKNTDRIGLEESKEMVTAINAKIDEYGFEDNHILGRAYFQAELVRMQQKEILVSTGISVFLVFLIMMFIYRKPIGVMIALGSIGVGLIVFLGVLGMLGRELNAISALYPVLMLIVGTSDVVHIMTKYLDELKKGLSREKAILKSMKQIGFATLLTSLTTAAGFLSLFTSRIATISGFGLNAAMGVIIAYIVVIFLTTSLLSLFSADQISQKRRSNDFWDKWLDRVNLSTIQHPGKIVLAGLAFVVFCGFGMSKVSTNYNLADNLPMKAKITDDFHYFEAFYSGFRPVEYAVFAQNDLQADDYKVLLEIDKLEKKLIESTVFTSVQSINDLHKSLNRAFNNNRKNAYVLPSTERKFLKNKKLLDRTPSMTNNIMLSKDGTKTRVTTKIKDIGADSIKVETGRIDQWISENIDSEIITVRRTGTGLIVDKNAKYIREDLFKGLAMALLIVSLLMVFLFKDIRMLIISLIPNLLPLLFAAAIIGYFGIELEAGISIVFAVVFGIAVDDTIHFLSKYKLARGYGLDKEEAISVTFKETGKAIIFTSIILFFGFMVMLFSNHVATLRIGMLVSLTLFSALICDMYLIPIMIRKWMKD